MQPENSHIAPQGAENLPPPAAVGPENIPSLPPLEAAPIGGLEKFEQAAEAGVRVSDATAQAVPVVPVAPAAAPQQAVADPQQANTASPLVAADEDLIEKEWIDKAKEIIHQTKDDPYTRTAKVNELQRDYLQKRYGKVVGASD